jgi:hypothetical protein
MQMGMMRKRLPPGVQDGNESDECTQVPVVGGDLQQRSGSRLEEEPVGDLRVLKGQRGKRVRQCEDDVGVRDRQKIGALALEPPRRGGSLALRTVAISAGGLGDLTMTTGVARLDVPVQSCGPTRGQRSHDPGLIA